MSVRMYSTLFSMFTAGAAVRWYAADGVNAPVVPTSASLYAAACPLIWERCGSSFPVAAAGV